MVDQAYERWASDIQAGVSSILIAPDNETVTALNERAHAELVDKGTVDAVLTVRLSDELYAGRGDTVIARKNDRRLTDDSGDFIRNGTLIKITATPYSDGSVMGRRFDTGKRIRLSSEYLTESTELGYATTAHRSQGITVGTSHTLLTQGCLTRELFYVGMTRGRDSNTAYVCKSSPASDDELHEEPESTWLEIIGEVLAAQGSERAAHEVRDEEQENAYSLHRLAAEYDYLAQIAAAEGLHVTVDHVLPGLASILECSPSWGAGVGAWRRATARDPRAAVATLEHTIRRPGDAEDVMAVLHARLRLLGGSTSVGLDDWLHEELTSNRPDLSDMIAQVRSLAAARVQELKVKVLAGTDTWIQRVDGRLPSGINAIDRNTLAEQIAIYRDRWQIGDDPEPLGPPTADYEWERSNDRRQLEAELARLQSAVAASDGSTAVKVSVGAALTNVGWEI